jgi:hypothetical protein
MTVDDNADESENRVKQERDEAENRVKQERDEAENRVKQERDEDENARNYSSQALKDAHVVLEQIKYTK